MPRRGNYTLFSIRGIPVGVDWSWFLVLFVIIFVLSEQFKSQLVTSDGSSVPYLLAVLTAFLFFASILLHEIGHAVVARRNGARVTHITLWLFGGVAAIDRDSESAGEEFRVAAAGPAVTLLLIGAFLGVGAAIEGSAFFDSATFDENSGVSATVAVLAFLANINVLIFGFNMLPAFPMDGGRIARAAAWKLTGSKTKATAFAAKLGQAFAFLFVAGGVFLAISTSYVVGGIWLALIGWMIGQSARVTAVRNELSARIGDISVADVMDSDPVLMPGDLTVEEALDQYFLRYQWPWFPVVDSVGHFIGLLSRGKADEELIPRGSATVGGLTDADLAEAQQVRDDASIESLLGNEELRRLGALVAVDDQGRVSGVVSLQQIGRALRDAASGQRPSDEELPPQEYGRT